MPPIFSEVTVAKVKMVLNQGKKDEHVIMAEPVDARALVKSGYVDIVAKEADKAARKAAKDDGK